MTRARAFLFELLLHVAPALSLRCATGSAQIGRAGEHLAARHLRASGHHLLARNLRHPRGELDLVTRTGGTLAVVEVKTGKRAEVPHPARFHEEARRRRRLAAAELARRWGLKPRLDLVTVELSRQGHLAHIWHQRDL